MKKILETIKNFKYKTITAVIFLIITQLIYNLADINVFGIASVFAFLYLIFVIYRLIYHAIMNTYKVDNQKWLAMFFAGLTIAFTGLLIFIIIKTIFFYGYL